MHVLIDSEMDTVPSKLRAIIEAAYDLFAPYTLGTALDVCKVCCVTDKDEQLLLTTPLCETSRDMLNNGYFCSAHGHSRQENWEMKHFLPRVLELVSEFEFPCHSTEITFCRLDLDYPDYWKPAERELLDAYALTFFENCLRRYPLPDYNALTDLLIMFGLAHFDLTPLLQAWINAGTEASVTHFVDLLAYELRIISNRDVRLDNPFSDALVNSQVSFWLSSPAVRDTWAEQLENALLHGQLLGEQATQTSLAYEILVIGMDSLAAPLPPSGALILP